MKTTSGVVTLAQEQRFQLAGDDGVARFFVLAHGAPLEGTELQELCEAGRRVVVRYEDVPDLLAHVARRVELPRGG